MPPKPFFPDPLDDYNPEKPDFVPDDDDYTDDEECPVCFVRLDEHSVKQVVECALKEVSGGVPH